MTIRTFAVAVRRFWLTYLVVAAAVFAAGMAVILLAPSRYVSTARLMVSVDGSTTMAAYQNDDVAARRVRSYIPLITSGVVSQRVIDTLGLPMTPSQLDAKVDVANVPPKTPLIDIEVTDDSPGRAEQIAQTVATEFIRYASSIETPTGEDNHKVHTTVVTPATEAREDRLVPVLLGVLAAFAAALVGAAAVWIRAAREREHSSPIETNGSVTSNAVMTVEDPVSAAESS